MPGQMRGSNVDQRWQELANLLSLQPHGDPNGPIPPALPHHFGAHHHINPHHHHHPFHHPHHPIHHHPHFGPAGPSNNPYTTEAARSALIQNATLPPPELNVTGPYPTADLGLQSTNLGSAVASSMHLTNNTDPLSDPSSHYNKILENSHEAIYYPNSSHPNSDMTNHTTEGILSSLMMNDEALQLMDMMAVSDGMYAMRMLDSNVSHNSGEPAVGGYHTLTGGGIQAAEDRLEASSDSAVSSMGSERVPPMIDPLLSDNDWSETEHQHSSPYSDYQNGGKLYYSKTGSPHRLLTPVAQKKHQMFGKRFNHEQGSMPSHLSPYPSAIGLHPPIDAPEMKYSCSLDFARQQHDGRMGGALDMAPTNHTYALPPTHPDNPFMATRTQRAPKEKQQKHEHMSRDEKRARSLGLPLSTDEIINLPMDEFNERLSKHDLSESQLSLIRDIRRRGKNKVAAQNCRKRKIDQINQLENEVCVIRLRKQSLLKEHESLVNRRNEARDKYAQLYHHVFQGLRNSDGTPYNPHEWSLVHGPDGNVSLVPRHQEGRPSSSYESFEGPSPSRRGNSNSKPKSEQKEEDELS